MICLLLRRKGGNSNRKGDLKGKKSNRQKSLFTPSKRLHLKMPSSKKVGKNGIKIGYKNQELIMPSLLKQSHKNKIRSNSILEHQLIKKSKT